MLELDAITAPQNISLSPSPTCYRTCRPHPHPITAGLCGYGGRLLVLVASLAHADVGSIIIQYNGPGALNAVSDSPTEHRLILLHAANRAETASVIMPSRVGDSVCRLKFYCRSYFVSGYITH